MRLFGGTRRLGRRSRLYELLLAPLNVRERVVVLILIVSTVVVLAIGGAGASYSSVGSIVALPAGQCATDQSWQLPHLAEGVGETIDGQEFSVQNSATTQEPGELLCSQFSQNSVPKTDLAIYAQLRIQELADNQNSSASTIQDSQTESGVLPAITLNQASSEPRRLDGRSDPLGAINQPPSIDDVVRLSLSSDNQNWQVVGTFASDQVNDDGTIGVELPPQYANNLANLVVRLEYVASPDKYLVSVDSLFISYVTAVPKDIALTAKDDSAVDTEGRPVISQSEGWQFSLSSKDQGDGLAQGLVSRISRQFDPSNPPALDTTATITKLDNGQSTAIASHTVWRARTLDNADQWDLSVDIPSSFDSGRYRLSLKFTDELGSNQQIEQDFLWGVLAINADQSVYQTGQTSQIAMTVLNDNGKSVCNADLFLSISQAGKNTANYSTQDETISTSELCSRYDEHIEPDYSAQHVYSQAGEYDLELTARTDAGSYTIVDHVTVLDTPPVTVRRQGPTRIYPIVNYDMILEITARDGFKGQFSEFLPSSFIISPTSFAQTYDKQETVDGNTKLIWNVNLAPGQSQTLGYRFDAPDVSPEFYLLGPAELTTQNEVKFSETRQWQIAGDAVGDFAVYREATATEDIPHSLSTLDWDTTVSEGAGFTINPSGRQTVDLTDSGHYFVAYNIGLQDSGGTNRSEVNALIDLSGTNLGHGRSSCYLRRNQGIDECWVAASTIIDAAAGDDLSIEVQLTDSNSATAQRMAAESGLIILKLKDTWDFARINEAGGGQTFNSATFASVDWDTNDELDSTTFSRSGSDITLGKNGHYLITSNVMFNNSTTGNRRNIDTRLTLNGSEVIGTRGSAYLRATQGTNDHASSFSGIIEASAGDVLAVQAACEGETCGSITNIGGQSGMTIVKLPDSADYVRIYDSSGAQTIDSTSNVAWDANTEIDSSSFSHSTSVNNSRTSVNQDGDYLFFGNFYANRTSTTNTNRLYPHWRWAVNGTSQTYGSFGQFNRGDNGSEATWSSGNSGVFLASLSNTDYVELINTDEGTAADSTATFQTNRSAVQGVNLDSLFSGIPSTQQLHYRWRDDTTALNTNGGFIASEDNDPSAQTKTSNLRLRISSANIGSDTEAASRSYELQFGDLTGLSACSSITTWTGVTDSGSDAFTTFDSANISPDGQATTSSLLANTEAYSRVNGEGRDSADNTGAIGPLAAGDYTELEYAISITSQAITGHSYCFRLYDLTSGAVLDGYNEYPALAIAGNATSLPNGLGEAGTFSSAADGGWTTVNFSATYTTPVVVGTTNSHNGQEALVFESRNVSSTSADMRVCESEGATANGCDTHSSETVGYMVIDAAVAANVDGIEAGSFTASGRSDNNSVTTNFSESFSVTPMVFANVNTVNSSEFPIEVVIPTTSISSFDAGICDHLQGSNDTCDGSHGNETVGWVAIEPGNEPFTEQFQDNILSVDTDGTNWQSISFSPSFASAPVVLYASQTDTGGQDVEIDEARSVTTTGADIRFCEIDTLDNCDNHNADTGAWLAIEAGQFNSDYYLDQNGFRFYANADDSEPSTPLASEDTSYDTVDNGDVIRLRLSAQNGVQDLSAGLLSLKLQYGQGATCSAIGSWTDVGAPGSGVIWRGHDNASPADGDSITSSLLNGGGNVTQSYEESNNSANNPNALDIGDIGEWDWVIENNGAANSTSYCFRVVTSDDSTIYYSTYPQVTTTAGVHMILLFDGTPPVIQQDDFDPNIDGSQWSDTTGMSAATFCASSSGNALHSSGGTDDVAETIDLDVRSGGSIDFDLFIAGTDAGSCNAAEPGEDVLLQYSTDGGGGWTTITTYNEASYPTMTPISQAIPAGAQTTSSRFRWVQVANSGEGFDHWVIDDLTISTNAPTDWSCISCTSGDAAYQRFLRGESAYGTTGGAVTHTHTASGSAATTAATGTESFGTTTLSLINHAHSVSGVTFTPASNLPQYRQLRVISSNASAANVNTIPTGAIGLFDTASLPTNWSQYSAQDNNYVRAENTVGSTGGSNTHTHPVTANLNTATGGTTGRRTGGTQVPGANAGHTHSFSTTSSSANNQPPYIQVVLGQVTTDTEKPDGLIAMFDGTPPADWTCNSCSSGQALYQRFFKPTTSYGTTGGSATHNHANFSAASSGPSATTNGRTGSATASGAHTHNVTISSVSTVNNLPPYVNLIFAKGDFNSPPNTPTSLSQEKTDTTNLAVGDWTNEGTVVFKANGTDQDASDTIQLCVEVKPIATSFSGSNTACGSGVAYSGSPVNLSVSIGGLSDGSEYHWQARVKDAAGQYSAWASFGGNGEGARDVGVDTSAPTGTVYDGTTTGVDVDLNDGTLDSLDANWIISSSASGLSGYEYSIGTSQGATDIVGWTSNGTSSSVTANSLNLNTSQPYYFNIRTTDNAGNQSVIFSDGLFVSPTLSFSASPGAVAFDNLNAGNSFTDTETSILTTSTNAYNGYEIRAYITAAPTSQNLDVIGLFNGGTYAVPDEWLGGDSGYGYTSNDTTIQGSNKFGSTPCGGGGNPPCYAPLSLSAPGDIVADHTSLVVGTPVTNENFILTHRVTVDPSQPAGTYQTELIYSITARY